MSVKEWIYCSKDKGFELYQDMKLAAGSELNQNPAVLRTDSPANFNVTNEVYAGNYGDFNLEVEIPSERFDEIAIAWCKK